MAGRPAAARGGGLTGLHYALISFVILTVVCLALLIFMLTNVGKYREDAERLKRQLEAVGTPNSYYTREATAQRSNAFAVIEAQLRRMSETLIGDQTAVPPAITEAAKNLLAELSQAGMVNEGDSLVGALRTMYRKLRESNDALASAQQSLDSLRADYERQAEGIRAAQEDFAKQVDDLRKRVEGMQNETEEALQRKDQQLAQLQQRSEQATEQYGKERVDWTQRERDLGIEISRLENRNTDLQKLVQDLKPSLFDPLAILNKADGVIIRAVPGSDVVYINLGAQDGLKAGMGFEVFSRYNRDGAQARGKASLEVVTLLPQTAECRVRRTTPGQPIVEGDIVVNLAYERDRKPKFVVIGDFDLNYDNAIDYDGRDQVAALIQQWGGQVVDTLDESTDFVVVGRLSRIDATKLESSPSVVVQDQLRTKQREAEEFANTIERAKTLYIPIVTQTQFLYLIGRTDVPFE